MLHSDAKKRSLPGAPGNINEITIDVICEVQKDLTTYDMTSLVFLLYDAPGTALERLILLQRVARDVDRKDLNLLYDWALHRQKDQSWRNEFLEALTTCQLYSVIRKLGFDVAAIKNNRKENPLDADFLNPMKKALYNLCENLNNDNVMKLKRSLGTFDVDVSEYESCELILLELMHRKFITVDMKDCNVQKLTMIIENIAGLMDSAQELRETEKSLNRERSGFQAPTCSSYHSISTVQSKKSITEAMDSEVDKFNGNFEDIFENLEDLLKNNLTITNLKTDAVKLRADSYQIKNPKRVGLCYIINQEIFHPSHESISHKTCKEPLEDRKGSSRDKNALTNTMKKLNFHVEAADNVAHQNILPNIKDVIQNKLQAEDSIFVLCILSHGIEGHVYGVDSVPVKVQDIQDMLDSEDARILRGKPKVLIIQACQVNTDKPVLKLEADGPNKPSDGPRGPNFFLKKSDFLVCWATAPEYEAWRDPYKGSVFIQLLCSIIQSRAQYEHLHDILTLTTKAVVHVCALHDCAQIPEVKTTLRNKLYLCAPERN